MTNTHINVGGHKITTNSMGTIHTAKLETGFTGNVFWIVRNGICIIWVHPLSGTTAAGGQLVTSDIPKRIDVPGNNNFAGSFHLGGSGSDASGNDPMHYYVNQQGLWCHVLNANISCYGEVVYPVADDWEEYTTSEQSAR